MAISETKTSWEFNPRVFDRKAHSKCLTKDIIQGKPCKTFNTDRCVDGTDDIWHGYYGTKAKFMKDFKKGYRIRNTVFYKIINEVPTILMIIIVILIIVKPNISPNL